MNRIQILNLVNGYLADKLGINPTELGYLASAQSGVVVASTVVVADANKDAASFRNLSATTLKAGKDAVAGTVQIFNATTAKGSTTLTSTDNTGNTVTSILVAAQAAARTYTIPDAGAATASFVMTAGTNTFAAGSNFAFDTATGTKIGTAASQKIGFWNATPIVQPSGASQAAVTPTSAITGSDTVSAATVLASIQALETLTNALRTALVNEGLIKGSE